MKNKGRIISFEEMIGSEPSKTIKVTLINKGQAVPSHLKEPDDLYQCPCDPACKCKMDEPCKGCETYGEWLNRWEGKV
jgi:hypothetical protein